jgi:hypothetical protein
MAGIDGNKLNYGQVPSGGRMKLTFTIKNVTNERLVDICAAVQDPLGPFSVSSGVRTLEPGEVKTVIIVFAPTQNGAFFDNVEVRSGPTCLRYSLRGSSATPTLHVTCADDVVGESARLRFDACQLRQLASKTLRLSNPDQFPVTFDFSLSSDIPRGGQTLSALLNPMAVEAEMVRFFFQCCDLLVAVRMRRALGGGGGHNM